MMSGGPERPRKSLVFVLKMKNRLDQTRFLVTEPDPSRPSPKGGIVTLPTECTGLTVVDIRVYAYAGQASGRAMGADSEE